MTPFEKSPESVQEIPPSTQRLINWYRNPLHELPFVSYDPEEDIIVHWAVPPISNPFQAERMGMMFGSTFAKFLAQNPENGHHLLKIVEEISEILKLEDPSSESLPGEEHIRIGFFTELGRYIARGYANGLPEYWVSKKKTGLYSSR